MKRVIRIFKAVPWIDYLYLSLRVLFKMLKLIIQASVALIVLIMKLAASGNKKKEEDDFWSPVGPDAHRRRPDLYRSLDD